MRIALVQLSATTDPVANLAAVEERIAALAAERLDLIVFPEAAICSFARPRLDVAESLDGRWATAVARAAERAGVAVVVGTFTPSDTPGKVHNTLLVTGPGLRAHYDKLHLFDALGYRESEQIAPGDRLVLVEVAGVKVGLTTCYDIRFPALYQELARHGAEVIVVPSSWAPGPHKVDQWRSLAIARALDSSAWIVAVDQAEPVPDDQSRAGKPPTGVGYSMVVDPFGVVVAELGPAPGVLVVEIDASRAAAARQVLPVLANSRFETSLRGGDASADRA